MVHAADEATGVHEHRTRQRSRDLRHGLHPNCPGPVRKRHYQVSAHVLDVEWRPVATETWKVKGTFIPIVVMTQQVEASIEDFHPSRLEVGRVEPRVAIDLCNRTAFVNRSSRTILHNHCVRIDTRIPTRDRPVLGYKQEDRFRIWVVWIDEKCRRCVENCSVGADVPLPSGVGIVTTSACGTPVALYKVERPVPLSDTHQGLPLARDKPRHYKIGIRVGGCRRSSRRIGSQVSAMIQLCKSQSLRQHGHAGDGDNHSTNHRNPHTETSTV